MKASVILPCYNESGSVGPLLRRLLAALEPPFELLVVDDSSPDGTAAAALAAAGGRPEVRVIVRGGRGLTSALQRGLDEATGEVLAWMDCDLSMPPEKMAELVRAVRSGRCDAAVGSRYVAGGGDLRLARPTALLRAQFALSLAASRACGLLLGGGFRDWTSGFIAVRRGAPGFGRLRGDFGEYFIRLVAGLLGAGARVEEIPYSLGPRLAGESKMAVSAAGLLRRTISYAAVVLDCLLARAGGKRN